MISSQELRKIKKIKGKIRGTAFRNDFDCVKEKGGKKQLDQVKKRLRELGCEEEIYQEKISIFNWYPLWCHVLFFVILNEEMGWREKDIFNIGFHGTRASLVLRIIPKQAFNLEKIFSQSHKYWDKNFSVGKMEAEKYDLKEKYVVLKLKEFNVHPLECWTIKGYLAGFMDILGKSDVQVKETKCTHQGNKFHQFKITWK